MPDHRLFTSESVTEGHPDKVCDQISDAILDGILADDPYGRVACETLATTGLILVSGEITTTTYVDIPNIVRKTLADIGYTRASYGISATKAAVLTSIDEQSPEIAQGVEESNEHEQGAGDQGHMFGFACNETPELMPLPIQLAQRITRRLAELRKSEDLPWLRPDGKSQVTVEYDGDRPVAVKKVVVATQHDDLSDAYPDVRMEHQLITKEVVDRVVLPVLVDSGLDFEEHFIVNGTGRFVMGGPQADTGLTGRKIIVDTYGGYARHGGGAFSGKDPSKVDRSAAYMTRYIAKNVVGAELARRCEVQLAYSIGVAEPVSVSVDTFGTGRLDDRKIGEIIREEFPLKPREIIQHLDLLRPIYQKTAAYGHFGREDDDFTWERLDKAEALKAYLK
ncbi:MAG: methionine adenosyltransferase [Fidelibacterota bacterium]|nr:MAG: methionine adenosyltransferase [Candidatus Neomarinimicrobiota bacterium]